MQAMSPWFQTARLIGWIRKARAGTDSPAQFPVAGGHARAATPASAAAPRSPKTNRTTA